MGKFASRLRIAGTALIVLSASVCWSAPFDNAPELSQSKLFNERDLQGWRPTIRCDANELSPQDREVLTELAADDMSVHWQAAFGILQYDGAGKPIETERHFGPCILSFQWKCEPCSSATIGLPGGWSVAIGDADSDGADQRRSSGAIYQGCRRVIKPMRCTDQPLGEWNHMTIRVRSHQVDVWLNGCRIAVVDDIHLDTEGPITLDGGPTPLYFRNVVIEPLKVSSGEPNSQLP
ncbi:DUF1080 domain-containing protein [Blastopirellula sp. JC732]|uniref:DUF1080 domain-containing protein n=1 Tax=Blastopirellula sediminis TaxID=2894196 RepID=A0A9X1MHC0_9BACT|nr:DUF1080 domain-containing protein [Blastopirellula sediminis]MCC9604261.1 DUF1080 domain-containing protein [Blastopirellula sediminis]MCC9626781.1 DUF1080 domain-containing protein [Blastopirellula sediminis]